MRHAIAHGRALPALVAVMLLSVPSLVSAQACALPKPEGASTCNASPSCKPGCGGAKAVSNGSWSPCVGGGGIDMSMTRFLNECCACNGVCAQSPKVPPLRLWGYDQYLTANSGCESYVSTSYLANGGLDLPPGNPAGVWFLYQGQWAGTLRNDGCISVTRNVAEVSFTDPDDAQATPPVRRIDHNAWYVIMSATAGTSGGPWDFDSIQGGTGCPTPNAAVPEMERVPSVSIANRALPCVGNNTTTPIPLNRDPNFRDADITLTPATVTWYDETGQHTNPADPNPLVAGIQIMYTTGPEPETSEIALGGWKPTLNPVTLQGRAFFPLPVANPVRVTVPVPSPSDALIWFAARIIYRDPTVSAAGEFDPSLPNGGPQLGSPVGGHCGPVTAVQGVVHYERIAARRTPAGVRIDWATFLEDGTNGFIVERAVNSRDTGAFTVTVGEIPASGSGSSYSVVDAGATDLAATYHYRIQEMTDDGLGTMSDVVSVGPISRSGGRGRGMRGR